MRIVREILGMMAAAIVVTTAGRAGAASAEPIRLWDGDAPGARGQEEIDIPTLTPWLVDGGSSATAAVVVCPGGGYHTLAPHEGEPYARWLNEQGISAFVLKYRLGRGDDRGYRHPVMVQDASRAVRLVRAKARAGEWRIDPARVGIMGSSAGGHLASTLMTHFDSGITTASDPIERESSRPDLGILCYPVISFGPLGHHGSMRFLLGENPPEELVKLLSNELQVTKATPPAFLFHTADDAVVRVENSLLFAGALAREGVPVELHIYPHGEHGLGLGTWEWNPSARHPWTTECERWLKEQDFGRK